MVNIMSELNKEELKELIAEFESELDEEILNKFIDGKGLTEKEINQL